MRRIVMAMAVLGIAGPAYAQPVAYSWTGMGTNVPGSSKCPTYKMTIDVTVEGRSVMCCSHDGGGHFLLWDGRELPSACARFRRCHPTV